MKSWSAIREAEISNIASVLDGGVPRGTEEHAVADMELGDRGCAVVACIPQPTTPRSCLYDPIVLAVSMLCGAAVEML